MHFILGQPISYEIKTASVRIWELRNLVDLHFALGELNSSHPLDGYRWTYTSLLVFMWESQKADSHYRLNVIERDSIYEYNANSKEHEELNLA